MVDLSSIIKAAIFLSLLFFSGYIYSWSLFPCTTDKSRLGASVILGNILFVWFYKTFGFLSPWDCIISLFFFCSLVGSITYYFSYKDSPTIQARFSPTFSEILLWAGLVFFYFFIVWKSIGYDELFNFHFASQVRNGQVPPVSYGFPEFPAKYHYGWGILLGSLASVSKLPLPVVSDVLTLYALTGAIFLFFALLHIIKVTQSSRLIGAVVFFLGGGVFVLPNKLLTGELSGGMGSVTMFQSHPWTFGFGLFLLILCCIAYCYEEKIIKPLTCILLGCIPISSLSFVNATSFSFVLLTCLVLVCYFFLKMRRDTRNILWAFCALLSIPCWIFLWKMMGGIMDNSLKSGNVSVSFSISSLGWALYIKYMIAYILLGISGFIGMIVATYYVVKCRFSILNINPAIILLAAGCLFLFPVPFFVWFKSFAAWDNLCKFTYFGILSGWIFLIWFVDKYKAGWNLTKVRSTISVSFILLFLCHESIILLVRFQENDMHKTYYSSIEKKKDLINYLKTNISLKHRVIILNKYLTSYYETEKLSGQKVNLYKFIGQNFGDFTVVAKETGTAFVNFHNFSRVSIEGDEWKLLNLLNAVHKGEVPITDFKKEQIKYILCMNEKTPDYINNYLKNDKIILTATDNLEGWSIWQIL